MSATAEALPVTEIVSPSDQPEVAQIVERAYESSTPIYPIGGGTSLEGGLATRRPGIGLSLAGLDRIVDYPWRDMTITVEAGIRMARLAQTLAEQGQRLPIDAAQAAEATLGGVVAANFSGPRRYGYGTVRDYVIGISAVDGRGTPFKGGGRVVKNVAGYDFCKLLTGSMGTLGVITQLTLKVVPLPESTAFLSCELQDWIEAEKLLAALVKSRTTPAAIELLAGPAWNDSAELGIPSGVARLAVGLEGTAAEVDWMVEQLSDEWHALGVPAFQTLRAGAAARAWELFTEFAARRGAAMALKLNVRPSAVASLAELLLELDLQCSIQSHAGNGIILAQFAEFAPSDVSRVLIQRLQPAAAAAGGSAVVWSAAAGGELTHQAVWGIARDETAVMRAVKEQFDPRGLLNPGRFVYGTGG